MPTADITVIGGISIDHFMIAERLPNRGECLISNNYRKAFGGKGANVALALYRSCHERRGGVRADPELARRQDGLDVHISLIGGVGNDEDGIAYKQHLEYSGIDVSKIRIVSDKPTGTVFIMVDEATRDNRILASLGANGAFTAKDFCFAESLGRGGVTLPDLVVAQLEFSAAAVEQMLETAGRSHVGVLLNASPAQHIREDLYRQITHFVVNETEAAFYSGREVEDVCEGSWAEIAQGFLSKGVENAVITLGENGAFYANEHGSGHVPAFKVEVVDATGAGYVSISAIPLFRRLVITWNLASMLMPPSVSAS